jgi:hypothetical protein
VEHVIRVIKNGVAEWRDESGRDRHIPEFEIVKSQPNGMSQHFFGFGITQGFAMQSR